MQPLLLYLPVVWTETWIWQMTASTTTTSSSFLPPRILPIQQQVVSTEISMIWTNDASTTRKNSSGPPSYYPWRPWRVDQSRHPQIFHFGIPPRRYCDGGLIYYCWLSCNPQCPFVYFLSCSYRQFLPWQMFGMFQWFGPCPATWQSLSIFSLMTIDLPPSPFLVRSPPSCLLLVVSIVVCLCLAYYHPSSPPTLMMMTFPPCHHY
mmetsp:Transcript_27944/g.43927  ORF Transcript_27944/g.43927 Transcript_27944/m.43927 type:complete len:206 (+) Transcript_27944:540-1157(+)